MIVEPKIPSIVVINGVVVGGVRFFLAAVLDRIYLTLLWLPNIDFHAFIFALIIDRERSNETLLSWTGNFKTDRQKEVSTRGAMLFREILCGAEKGKIRELHSATFPLGFKTLEFFLQTFQYWSESYYIMSWFRPAWMYVVSMLVEQIRSFARFGKRRTMFSTDLKLWQEGNQDTLLHNDKAALPKLKSCQ